MYPELKWSEETYMLWRIEHQLRSLAWGLSDKKHRPPQEPQPLKTPGQLAELKRHQRPREQGGNRRDSRIRRTGWRLA